MPITRTLLCPDCAKSFSWLFMARDESDFPDFCPKCGSSMTEEPTALPGAPHIATAHGKVVDATVRQYFDASQTRAEMSGDPAMKITDLKDSLREGDVAGVVPVNEVTKVADQMGHQYFQGGTTADVISQSRTGRERGTGATALRAIQGGAPPNFTPPSSGIKGSFGGGTA